jgi:imidazoleglycerol-phosphate dehydratase
MSERKASVQRKTKETTIDISCALDGSGKADIDTGVGFFDHMLELLAVHSLLDLTIRAVGDVKVDDHHTVEDVGIALGQCLDKALGDKKGLVRFADAALPMDEALARVALDISGRGCLVYNVQYPTEKTGQFDTGLVQEFLGALSANARLTLHVEVPYGTNSHHIAESIFKGLARALRIATRIDPERKGVPSSKGVL